MGNWKKSRHMVLMNRGLETKVTMEWLPATESYRIVKRERMVGGIPTVTYDRILTGTEAVDSFHHLCVEAVETEWTMPERKGVNLIDLTKAEDGE